MGWDDPDANPLQDLLNAKKLMEEEYDQVVIHYPRQAGKATMQNRMMEEINETGKEVEELKKKEKRKPSDFLNEDGTLNETRIQMLTALQGRQIYAGTADPEVVRKRRAKNKVARASRRKNRK